ncbi:hypothetical protein Q5752_002614 [Cryptotrichosporon argae]
MSVLVLHDAAVDPYPFLSRLTGAAVDASAGPVPWRIDNKYYTADVTLLPTLVGPQLAAAHATDVILYLYAALPSPLSPDLTRYLLAYPADIALAVRVKHGRGARAGGSGAGIEDRHEGGGGHEDEDEERLAEVGLELVDEAAVDTDDERPLEPIESVRQTLMTHIWPGMLRKPATRTRFAFDNDADADDDRYEDGHGESLSDGCPDSGDGADEADMFPVSFGQRAAGTLEALAARLDWALGGGGVDGLGGGEDEDWGVDGVSVDESGSGSDWGELVVGQDEYARLDEWLDADADDVVAVVCGDGTAAGPTRADGAAAAPADADQSFDDDFASLPAGAARTSGALAVGRPADADVTAREATLPLDPTPLLLHLQAVRAELADVEDEDERRARAGREVERLMASLGM